MTTYGGGLKCDFCGLKSGYNMGEMADYYEDLFWDGEDQNENYFETEDGSPQEFGFTGSSFGRKRSRSLPCAYCKAYPLKWGQYETGWRLFHPDGKLHSCAKYTKQENNET